MNIGLNPYQQDQILQNESDNYAQEQFQCDYERLETINSELAVTQQMEVEQLHAIIQNLQFQLAQQGQVATQKIEENEIKGAEITKYQSIIEVQQHQIQQLMTQLRKAAPIRASSRIRQIIEPESPLTLSKIETQDREQKNPDLTQITELRQEIEQLQKMNEHLKDQINQGYQVPEDITVNSLTRQLQQAEFVISEQQKTLMLLQQQVEAARTESQQQSSELKLAQTHIAELSPYNNNLSGKSCDIEDPNRAMNKSSRDKQRLVENQSTEKKAKLEEEIQRLQHQKLELSQIINELNIQKQSLSEDLKKQQHQANLLQLNCELQLKELEQSRATSVNELQLSRAKSSGVVGSRVKQKQLFPSQVLELQKKCAELDDENKQLNKRSQLNESLQVRQSRINPLTTSKISDEQQLEKKVVELNNKLESCQQQQQNQQVFHDAEVYRFNQQISELQQQLEHQHTEHLDQQQQLDIAQVSSKNQQLQDKLVNMQRQLIRQEQNQQSVVQDLEEQIQMLQLQNKHQSQSFNEEKQVLETVIQTLREKSLHLEIENSNLKAKPFEIDRSILQAENQMLKERISQLLQMRKPQVDEVQTLDLQISQLNAQRQNNNQQAEVSSANQLAVTSGEMLKPAQTTKWDESNFAALKQKDEANAQLQAANRVLQTQIEQLNGKIKQLLESQKQELQTLQSSNRNYEQQLQGQNERYSTLQGQLQQNEHRITVLSSEKSFQEQELLRLNQQNFQLQQQLDSKIAQVAKMEDTVSHLSHHVNDTQSQNMIELNQRRTIQLQSELEDMQTSMSHQINRLKEQIQTKDQENRKLQDQVTLLQSNNQTLKQDFEKQNIQISNLQQDLKKQADQSLKMQQDLEQKLRIADQEKSNQLSDSIQQLKKQNQVLIDQLQQQKFDAEKQSSALAEKLQESQNKLKHITEQMQLVKQSDDSTNDFGKLVSQQVEKLMQRTSVQGFTDQQIELRLQEFTTTQQKTKELEQTIHTLELENGQQVIQLDQLQKQRQLLEQQLTKRKDEEGLVIKLKTEIRYLRDNNSQLAIEVSSVRRQINQLEEQQLRPVVRNQSLELSEQDGMLTQLEAMQRQMREIKTNNERQLAMERQNSIFQQGELTKTIEQLKAELEEIVTTRNSVRTPKAVNVEDSGKTKLMQENENLVKQLGEVSQQLTQLQTQVQTLDEENNELADRLLDYQNLQINKPEEKTDFKADGESRESVDTSKYLVEIDQLKQYTSQLLSEKNQIKQSLDKNREKTAEIQKELDYNVAQVKALNDKLQELADGDNELNPDFSFAEDEILPFAVVCLRNYGQPHFSTHYNKPQLEPDNIIPSITQLEGMRQPLVEKLQECPGLKNKETENLLFELQKFCQQFFKSSEEVKQLCAEFKIPFDEGLVNAPALRNFVISKYNKAMEVYFQQKLGQFLAKYQEKEGAIQFFKLGESGEIDQQNELIWQIGRVAFLFTLYDFLIEDKFEEAGDKMVVFPQMVRGKKVVVKMQVRL